MQAAHEIINIRWQTLYYLEKGSNREFWTPRDESVFQPGSLLRSVNVYHSERFHSIHASFLAPFRMGHQTLSTKVMMTLIQKLWYATAGKRGLFFLSADKGSDDELHSSAVSRWWWWWVTSENSITKPRCVTCGCVHGTSNSWSAAALKVSCGHVEHHDPVCYNFSKMSRIALSRSALADQNITMT